MSDVKWIKITTDVFDDEKVLLIESLPEADSIIVIWFKLLCLAGKMNNSGVFMMNNRIAYTESMLATIFRRKKTTIQLALDTFERFGMIERIDGVITIPNWGKHQNLDQIESKKEYMRNYMHDYREKQKGKIECKTNSKTNSKTNVSSLDKDIDIDKDIDKDIDIENKEKVVSKDTTKKNPTVYYLDESLNKAFHDFIEMRKKIKKPMTDRAIELQMKKLHELSLVPFTDCMDNDLAIKILEQSTMNCWQSLYQLKENGQQGSNVFKEWRDA